jgi:hypothetical protein
MNQMPRRPHNLFSQTKFFCHGQSTIKRLSSGKIVLCRRRRTEGAGLYGAPRTSHQTIDRESRKFLHHPCSQLLPLTRRQSSHLALDSCYIH